MRRRSLFLTAAVVMAACCAGADVTGTAIVKAILTPSSSIEELRPSSAPARVGKFTVDRSAQSAARVEVFWRTPAGGLPPGVYVVLELREEGRAAARRLLHRCTRPVRGPQYTVFDLREVNGTVAAGAVSVVYQRSVLARSPLRRATE